MFIYKYIYIHIYMHRFTNLSINIYIYINICVTRKQYITSNVDAWSSNVSCWVGESFSSQQIAATPSLLCVHPLNPLRCKFHGWPLPSAWSIGNGSKHVKAMVPRWWPKKVLNRCKWMFMPQMYIFFFLMYLFIYIYIHFTYIHVCK